MDEIVKQALAKWPNVPHCYGWLALDARGGWRMRDEQAQAQGLSGDRITHPALLSFINRNYTHDDYGYWYFQNGPQRVYVNLEATPYIARTDPAHGFILHTGELLSTIDAVWLTETGQLILESAQKVAQIDDRDVMQCLGQLRIHDLPVNDERLLTWIADNHTAEPLTFLHNNQCLPVQRIAHCHIAAHFGFLSHL